MWARSQRAIWLSDFDGLMCGVVAAICAIGLASVYSTTLNTRFPDLYTKHVVWLVLGALLFWMMSRVDYQVTTSCAPLLFVAAILGLVAVLVFGDTVNGARRWLALPLGFSLQVSELIKVVLVLLLANLAGKFSTKGLSFRGLATIVSVVLGPALLIAIQPDLGTALSLVPLLGTVLWISPIRAKHLVCACMIGILLIPFAWSSLKPYQKDRITGFLDPAEAPLESGYQILQSQIAVGSGGIWGQGFLQGTQTQLRFLPTPHTDFILASLGEEWGFVGVTVLLALYYALLMLVVRTARSAKDAEGTLIAMGVATLLLFHVTVSVGMVANMLPVTGLPLPLMSYGGSNMVAFLAMLGLVNSVWIRRIVN